MNSPVNNEALEQLAEAVTTFAQTMSQQAAKIASGLSEAIHSTPAGRFIAQVAQAQAEEEKRRAAASKSHG